jgi:hypothetical protein
MPHGEERGFETNKQVVSTKIQCVTDRQEVQWAAKGSYGREAGTVQQYELRQRSNKCAYRPRKSGRVNQEE